jgi:hypothetical protein
VVATLDRVERSLPEVEDGVVEGSRPSAATKALARPRYSRWMSSAEMVSPEVNRTDLRPVRS